MMRQVVACVLGMFVVMAASGCSWFERRSDTGGAVQVGDASSGKGPALDAMLPMPQAQPPISDVPVPINYKIDESKSRNYAVAGTRFVDHVYTGKGDKFVIKRFFERYMVMNRWTLATFIFAQGRIMLDFEKDTERCRITIWESNFFLGPTTVSVLLWPNKPLAPKGEVPRT